MQSEETMKLSALALLAVLVACQAPGPIDRDTAPRNVQRVEADETGSFVVDEADPAPGGEARPTPAVALTPGARLVSVAGCVIDAEGFPVPEVRVGWATFDGPTQPGDVTDGAGHFEFALPLPTADHYVAEALDGRRTEVYLGDRDRANVRIRLPRVPVGPLEGRVLLPDGRTPVADASVHLGAHPFGRREVRTGADGRFRFRAVPTDGSFGITVEAYAHGRRCFRDLRWAPDVGLDIVLPEVRSLNGRVVRRNERGEVVGVPGVEVSAYNSRIYEGPGVVSGPDGRFVYEGRPHGCGFRIRPWWVWRCVGSSPIWEWGTPGVVIEVEPARPLPHPPIHSAWVAGSVLDEAGEPVPDCTVRLWWSRMDETLTDDAGRFRFDGLDAAPLKLSAKAFGYDYVSLGIDVPAEGKTLEPIRLRPLLARVLRVVDEDGAPLLTAAVSTRLGGSDVPVEEDGRVRVFVAGGAGHGYAYGPDRVWVDAPGYVQRQVWAHDASESGEKTVCLWRTQVLAGIVLDAAGRPVRSARVHAKGIRGTGGTSDWDDGLTDLAGRFRIEVQNPGTYRLTARHLNRVLVLDSEPEVETGTEDAVIRASLPLFVAGRLVDPDGNGIPGVWLSATPVQGGGARVGRTDDSGRFRIEGVMGRIARIEAGPHYAVLAERGLTLRTRTPVTAGRSDIRLVAERAPTISGVVLWPDGRPAVGVRVDALHAPTLKSARAETNAQGRFGLIDILPGKHDLSAYIWVEVEGKDVDEPLFEAVRQGVETGTRNLRLVLRLIEDD
jgi:Carboxypeptidase regulatory-like domain